MICVATSFTYAIELFKSCTLSIRRLIHIHEFEVEVVNGFCNETAFVLTAIAFLKQSIFQSSFGVLNLSKLSLDNFTRLVE